jgi:hypothetical protein
VLRPNTSTYIKKEQRLVRDDKEIEQLKRTIAARFAYWALTKNEATDDATNRKSQGFFGSTNN